MPQQAPSAILQLGVLLVLTGCVAVWAGIIYRWNHGQAVLPFTPRRPVPWKFIDLAVILLAFLLLAFWLSLLGQLWLGVKIAGPGRAPAAAAHAAKQADDKSKDDQRAPGVEDKDLAHPVIVILQSRPAPAVLVFCFLIAVVVAPVAEEIVFRLLLQGWLETVEWQWRRRIRAWRQLARGAVPIVLVAAIFALGHYRTESPEPDVRSLVFLFAVDATAKIFAIGIGLGLIWYRRGATSVDFGLVPERFWGDVGLGLLAYLAVVPPVFAIQAVATSLLPHGIAADPIALFVLALALGTLYYRTHRIVPVIVTHMALNATSLTAAWLLVAK